MGRLRLAGGVLAVVLVLAVAVVATQHGDSAQVSSAPATPESPQVRADTLTQLNRSGRFQEVLALAPAHLETVRLSRDARCQGFLSWAYAAIRLTQPEVAASALESAKRECVGYMWADRQLAQLEGAAEVVARVPELEAMELEAVLIHPLHAELFSCTEHRGVMYELGDRFGADCLVMDEHVGAAGQRWLAPYRGTGERNEDWFGWGVPVLAPFDGVVEEVRINDRTNTVGEVGEPPASAVVFLGADSLRVLYAHLGRITVQPGDRVVAGQVVGAVGNNGISKSPHTHVGAWRGDRALQIRFDIRTP